MTMMSWPSMMSKRSSDRMYGWRTCLTRLSAFSSCSAGRLVLVHRVEVAEDELDGLEDAAGGLDLPDLAEAAAAEPLDQPVARSGPGSSSWLTRRTGIWENRPLAGKDRERNNSSADGGTEFATYL